VMAMTGLNLACRIHARRFYTMALPFTRSKTGMRTAVRFECLKFLPVRSNGEMARSRTNLIDKLFDSIQILRAASTRGEMGQIQP